MPKFVIEREMPGVGSLERAELVGASQKSCGVLHAMGPQIQWLHSYITDNKVYCVYLAPDDTTIKKHADMIGIPANRISAVRSLLEAADGE